MQNNGRWVIRFLYTQEFVALGGYGEIFRVGKPYADVFQSFTAAEDFVKRFRVAGAAIERA